MKKHIWRESYAENGFPPFPCPRCSTGSLCLDKDTLKKLHEPARDEDYYNRGGAFSGLLKCSISWCGEVVSMAGVLVPSRGHDQVGEMVEEDRYHIKALVSQVPVIDIPKKTPAVIEKPIRAAFSMLWSDRGAAANKLRISVERILDHFEVPVRSERGGGCH
ncbi:hypothetical protein [Mesorhizobium sp. L2C089B000]|uniref:hypothetical protein n=2 Tax=unclassified Mesorhizobium TaxID=325217 RepID=UPI0012EBB765|nr:hypothetical protein [Mesorhizobium sp. L2C089B000]